MEEEKNEKLNLTADWISVGLFAIVTVICVFTGKWIAACLGLLGILTYFKVIDVKKMDWDKIKELYETIQALLKTGQEQEEELKNYKKEIKSLTNKIGVLETRCAELETEEVKTRSTVQETPATETKKTTTTKKKYTSKDKARIKEELKSVGMTLSNQKEGKK